MPSNLSAIQLLSEAMPEHNLAAIKRALRLLSPQKNQLVLLPENALCFANGGDYIGLAETLGDGVYQSKLAALAKQYQCYLICGSFPIKSVHKNKVYTSTLVFSPLGQLLSHYHKIHLFDALVVDNKGRYKESDTFVAGENVTVFDWQCQQGTVKVGLAICYDLRFPGLFQRLREMGADILLLPAAFTQVTGNAHWLPLLQARAIENQCYIVAANQGGKHLCGRETYGHSMIISPWGEILDELGYNEGSVTAIFDKIALDKLREAMPLAIHNRFSSLLKK